jgi:hypothetical protein
LRRKCTELGFFPVNHHFNDIQYSSTVLGWGE